MAVLRATFLSMGLPQADNHTSPLDADSDTSYRYQCKTATWCRNHEPYFLHHPWIERLLPIIECGAIIHIFTSQLHLATLRDRDILPRLVVLISAHVLHLLDHVHALDYLAEHNMLAIEKGCWDAGDEELATVCVWARVLA